MTTSPAAPPRATHPVDERTSVWRFARHYVEMVAAMYLGMIVFSPVYGAIASRLGYPDPWAELPSFSAVVMAVEMTIPMVVLMIWHRHSARAVAEMSAAMLVPALGAVTLHLLGVVSAGSLMTIAHLGMFPAMMLAMALRYREYAGATSHHRTTVPARRTP